VVVGGGIAGLACAHALTRSRNGGEPARVTLLEKDERTGGKIRSEPIDGRTIDVGAESLLMRVPAAIELCRELDLERELVAPSTTATSVWARGRLRELPAGILAGLPNGAGPVLRSGILSPRGVARASLDLVFPRVSTQRDRSVADLIGGRLGRQALERLVDPLLGTIYGASCETLSLRATAPALEALAREHRSLIGSMLGTRRSLPPSAPRAAGPLFSTHPAGLERLVERLVEELRDVAGAEIRREARASLVVRDTQARYAVVLADGERVNADGVVIATPAFEAAALLNILSPRAAGELADIGYRSAVVATLVYPARAISRPLGGSGFLLPRREHRLLGACTVLSNKWPHMAGEEGSILRCSVARESVEQAMAMNDNRLVERLSRDLYEVAGVTGAPRSAHVMRWRDALPHYEPGHLERVERIERNLHGLPGIALAGAAYRGMGVPQCIAQGRTAAEKVLAATARSETAAARTR
jgi:protoporphyrinogen/coproporphyrinogen III oxidase